MPSYAKYTGISGGGGGGGGSGTVTSVALADGSSTPIYTVTGSPVTTSGTLTETLKTQSANKVFAGPTTGVAAQPTFRSLVAADLPFAVGNLTDAGTDGITVTGGTGAIIGSGTSIAQHVADASHNGYLSSTDWSTFNNKQSALTEGNLTEATSSILTISGGTNAVIGSGTSIQVKQSNTSTSGYLSNTDWNTFNGKAPYTAVATSASQLYNNFGTCTNLLTIYEIVGTCMKVQFTGTTGTLVSAVFSITLPASKTVNTGVYSSGQVVLGTFHRGVPSQSTPATSNGPWPIFYDSTNAIITVAISYAASTGILVNNTNTTSFMSNTQLFFGWFQVFIN